jgi:hypothetical protein
LDVLAACAYGKHNRVSFETLFAMAQAGLVRADVVRPSEDSTVLMWVDLTEEGCKLGTERRRVLEARKAKKRTRARETAQVMRDMGMVRTPYGWE